MSRRVRLRRGNVFPSAGIKSDGSVGPLSGTSTLECPLSHRGRFDGRVEWLRIATAVGILANIVGFSASLELESGLDIANVGRSGRSRVVGTGGVIAGFALDKVDGPSDTDCRGRGIGTGWAPVTLRRALIGLVNISFPNEMVNAGLTPLVMAGDNGLWLCASRLPRIRSPSHACTLIRYAHKSNSASVAEKIIPGDQKDRERTMSSSGGCHDGSG